jgi:predicted MPP superfamily phosphohydrolase
MCPTKDIVEQVDDTSQGEDDFFSRDVKEEDLVEDFLCDARKHEHPLHNKNGKRNLLSAPLGLRLLLMTKLLLVWMFAGLLIYFIVKILGDISSTSSLKQKCHYYYSPPCKPELRFHSKRRQTTSDITSTGFLARNDDQITTTSSSSSPFSSFQIMHITDIHLGEAQDTDWGPEQDRKTWTLLDKILLKYEHPDLIVLGGDQLTANDCRDNNCTAYYQLLGTHLTKYGIPWATVLGNHDDMPYHRTEAATSHNNGTPSTTGPHSYTRRQLLEVDESFALSLTQTGPIDVTGASNYVLQVMDDKNDNNDVALEIYFLDSGGGTIPQRIDETQVHWFQQQLASGNNALLPAIAFQHIPTVSHLWNSNENNEYGKNCKGFHGDGVNYIDDDAGLVDIMVNTGRFQFLAVGHNHGNDYCCSSRGMTFCFGRHSGYGGYGEWQRGVRMYELQRLNPPDSEDQTGSPKAQPLFSSDHQQSIRWRSWVGILLLFSPILPMSCDATNSLRSLHHSLQFFRGHSPIIRFDWNRVHTSTTLILITITTITIRRMVRVKELSYK